MTISPNSTVDNIYRLFPNFNSTAVSQVNMRTIKKVN